MPGAKPDAPIQPTGLELATFLRILWKNRKFLIGTVFCAMFLAGVASYLVEKTFRSHTKILVEVPKRREVTRIFSEPLTVLGYESLLNSDESFQNVLKTLKSLNQILIEFQKQGYSIDQIRDLPARNLSRYVPEVTSREGWILSRLNRDDYVGLLQFTPQDFEDLKFEKFKETFSSETTIEKETGVEVIYSPIIDMSAESNSPEKAAVKANLWALTFVFDIQGSLSESTSLIVEEIIKVGRSTQEELEKATRQQKQYEEEIGLARLKQELEAKNISLYGLTLQTGMQPNPQDLTQQVETESIKTSDKFNDALLPQLAQVEKTIQSTESQIDSLDAQLESMEQSGIWIGDLPLPDKDAESLLKKQIERASTALAQLQDSTHQQQQESQGSLRQEIQEKQKLIATQRSEYRALSAYSATPESATAVIISQLKTLIEQSNKELASLELKQKTHQLNVQKLAGLKSCLSALKARENYLQAAQNYQGAEAKNLTHSWLEQDLTLLSQQLQVAQAELIKIEAQLSQKEIQSDSESKTALQSQQSFYQKKILDYEKEKTQLRNQLIDQMKQNRLLADQVEHASASFNSYRLEYLGLKKRRESLALVEQENQSALKSLKNQVQTLQDEIESLSQKISKAETALTRYEKERETYEAALEDFSGQISEAVTERGRRISDVRVQARAVPPDRKVAPIRSLWVITAGFLVFLFDLGMILIRRLMEMVPGPSV